jgi:hypothetical protein
MNRKRRAAAAASGEENAKRARRATKQQGLATFDALCALNASLEDGRGAGLETWKIDPLREFDDDIAKGQTEELGLLVFTMDEVQYQMRMFFYLQRHLRLSVERMPPPDPQEAQRHDGGHLRCRVVLGGFFHDSCSERGVRALQQRHEPQLALGNCNGNG